MASDEETVAELAQSKGKECRIQDYKLEKRNAKSPMTRLLNKLAGVLGENNPRQSDIKELLKRIDEQKDYTLSVMNLLEGAYRENKENEFAKKASDEADGLVDQVDRKTCLARSVLASLVKDKPPSPSLADSLESENSERRRQKERAELEARLHKERLQKETDAKREELECQQRELQAVTDEVTKRRQELDDEIDAELGLPVKGNETINSTPPHQKIKQWERTNKNETATENCMNHGPLEIR